ncbi:UBC-like protein [Rhizoclosmatium globosum]|uniref:UBC-like protein n=1 Tax=Rhizoclosmatium globosum TaxID=329046 RepID=A0A1Y2D3T5_9FUNG|nr:UBC-like protein [Rhizoclosmatium globosum]|eukprot:ORY53225.1 UBC-like protein [Rhizoclosmatium globosum]
MSSIKKIGIPSNIPLKPIPETPTSSTGGNSSGGVGGAADPSLLAAAGGNDQIQRDIRIYSQYFRRYELLIEYKNLRNPDHCPNGMYIMPEANDLYEWWGVLLLHRGYYKEGVFKFHVQIPDDYPNEGPTVRFTTDMFHPLVDRSGFFSLKQQFPVWRAHKDYLCHVLHYIKNSFKEAVLAGLEEMHCPNREAYNMFMHERPLFARLASQCAQLSASDGILFSNELDEDENIIRFSPLDDDQFENLKAQMIASVNVDHVDKALNQKAAPNPKTELLGGIKSVTGNINRMLSS